jgi:hypothetical protein
VKSRRQNRVGIELQFPDGTSHRFHYENVPLPENDPFVRKRERTVGDSPPRIVTEFAAATERPSTYPARLPFLPNRPVSTIESQDGSEGPQARWRCQDPDRVVAAIVEASLADGWTLASPSTAPSSAGPGAAARLGRPGATRLVMKAERDAVAVVHLIEVDADWPDPSSSDRSTG